GLTVYQALDRAVEAGGAALAGKDIAGSGKAATALLQEMCSSGLLEVKAKKYTVTAKGQEAWEREAPEDRHREVQQRQTRQRHDLLIGLLAAVEKKGDGPLDKADLARFTEGVRREACDRKLVEAGAKKNCYRLLPAGADMLLANQPFERQL